MSGYLWLVMLLAALLLGLRGLRSLERACGADWGNPWLNRLDGLNRLFCRRFHRLSGYRLQLPPTGPALVASNHLSGLDPMLLLAAADRPLRFIIAREQYQRFGLTWLFRAVGCIPVDRGQRPERAFREALRALEAGEVVAIFPHGTIHLPDDPPRPLKPGVVRLAALADCPIYPVRVSGVRGVGHIVAAVFLRSHARLWSHQPLRCAEREPKACLHELGQFIEGGHDAGVVEEKKGPAGDGGASTGE